MKLKLNKKWLKIGLSILGIGVIASPIISLVSCSNSSSKSEWMNTNSPYDEAIQINASIGDDILVPFANQHPDMVITSPGKQYKVKLKDIDFTSNHDYVNEREWMCVSSSFKGLIVPEITYIQWSFPGKKAVYRPNLVYKYSTDTDFLTIRKLDFKLDDGLDAYEATSKKVLNLKFLKLKDPDMGHEFYAKLDVGKSLKYLLSHQWKLEKYLVDDD